MRYGKMLHELKLAEDRYEASVRSILQKFSKLDVATEGALLNSLKRPGFKNGKHWTQTPAGRKAMANRGKKAK